MSKLKEIKTKYGELSFELLDNDFLKTSNTIKISDNCLIGKVAVLLGHNLNEKEELLSGLTDDDFVWVNDEKEIVYHGLENINNALSNGSVLIIDSLNIDYEYINTIVETFNSSTSNPNNAQLLFSTNVVVEFACFAWLRTDQVWILDNNELYAISDFEDVPIGGYGYIKYFIAHRLTKTKSQKEIKEELGIKDFSND